MVPAFVALVASLLWPTLWTLWTSLRRGGLLSRDQFAGAANYGQLLSGSSQFGRALGVAFVLALVAILLVAAVAAPLAYLVSAGGRPLRLTARLVLSLPLAFFAPTAGATAWRLGLSASGGAALANPATALPAVVTVSLVATLGVACGTGLVVLLPALRATAGRRPSAAPFVAALAVLALAAAAAALQAFPTSYVLTGGGPAGVTSPPLLAEYALAFQRFQIGAGAAAASLILLVLALLGLAATALVVATGLRIELGDPAPEARPDRPPAGLAPVLGILGALLLAAVAAVALYGAWPRLAAAGLALSSRPGPAPFGSALLGSVLPPLVMAPLEVLVAFAAALGIGGLRPLGRWSEWLLLPFAPWLFVGPGPLSIAWFTASRNLHLLDTFPGLATPVLVSVPALLVLTLLCRGQATNWRALAAAGMPSGEAFLRAVVLPVLPMAALLAGATLLFQAQDLLWPLVAVATPAHATLPVLTATLLAAFGAARSPVAVAITLSALPGVVALVALGLAQVLYLDRLALRSERDD